MWDQHWDGKRSRTKSSELVLKGQTDKWADGFLLLLVLCLLVHLQTSAELFSWIRFETQSFCSVAVRLLTLAGFACF